jgi:hypothetical protein
MYRFVDLNDSYWANPDGSEDAQCAILDTRTNRFLECDGKHVFGDIDEVRDAAGERGVGLVPTGFFERKQAGTGQFVERHGVRGVLAAASERWLAEATDAAGKALLEPALTLDYVMRTERALATANVAPPYELRATAAALAGLAATLTERCNVEATEPEPMPALQPGETFVGRVSRTFLIAVDLPWSPCRTLISATPSAAPNT